MSNEITDFSVGDDIDIYRTVTNIPTGQVIESAVMEFRLFEADETPFLTKTISTTATLSGQITDTGADGTGEVVFTLQDTDTDNFTPGVWHYYSIKIETDAGKNFTPERGKIKANFK